MYALKILDNLAQPERSFKKEVYHFVYYYSQ